MNRKYLILNDNEELVVFGNNDGGVLIKNKNNMLNISETEEERKENLCIKNISNNEMTSFILSCLLENNHINLMYDKSKMSTQDLINKLLDKHYDLFCGKSYSSDEIKFIDFQCVTYYNK